MKGIRTSLNGDRTIYFSSSKNFKGKQGGVMDLQSMKEWYEQDSSKNHLGLIDVAFSAAKEESPMLMEFFTKGAIIKINGMSDRFTYDIKIEDSTNMTTIGDTSGDCELCGQEGSYIPIILTEAISPNVTITYDLRYGQQLIISDVHDVTEELGGFKHWARLVTENEKETFDVNFLKAGVEYFVAGHSLTEHSEQFATIRGTSNSMATMTCEFVLGNHRGVEAYVTKYANSKNLAGATTVSRQYWDYFIEEQSKIKGTDGNIQDMFVAAYTTPSGISKSGSFVGMTMEYLVILETLRLEAFQLMFQRKATLPTANGTIRLNEGIFHQFRRGNRYTYTRAGGITKTLLRKVSDRLFAGSSLLPHEREMTYECGRMAYLNMIELMQKEANVQLTALAPLLGADSRLPKGVLSGDLMNLEVADVQFGSVVLPNIGRIKLIYQPALDYKPLADRRTRSFVGAGYDKSSFTMIIKDGRDPMYSNAAQGLPSGVTLENPAMKGANVFYVVPEYGAFEWGRQDGRTSATNAKEMVKSAMKKMGTEYWAHSSSAGWVKSVDNIYIIELA